MNSKQFDAKWCSIYYNNIQQMKISPSVNLVVTMLLAMILLTGFALLLRNIFRSYRHKLELY